MEEYYSERAISNSKVLCVGTITQDEATNAKETSPFVDGFGYYLYIADTENPQTGVEIIAKCASSAAAHRLSLLLSRL